MEFENLEDYDKLDQMDMLSIDNIYQGLKDGRLEVKDEEKNISFFVKASFNDKEIDMLMAGGKLNSIKMRNSKEA
jgi:aconitate hydratase